jgi:hypothetical protein
MYKIIFIAVVVAIPYAQAAEWSITSQLNPSVEYDDNVFMSANNKESSMRYSMTPTVTTTRADENSNIGLSAGYRLQRYTSVDIDDSQDPFARFNSSFSTERSQYGLNLGYAETQTRDNAAEDTGNFRNNSTQTSKTISPFYSYQLTERDTLSFNGSYVDNSYDSNASNDNKLKSLTTDWMRQYTERLSAGLSVGVYNYKSDRSITSISVEKDNYNVLALLNYQVTELWLIDGRVGMRRLESELTNDLGFKEDNSSSGASFDITASRQGESDTLTMAVSQQLSPNSNGGVDDQQSVSVNWSRSLSDTLTAGISARYLESESAARDSFKRKREYYDVSPSISWQLDRNLGLRFSYEYSKQTQGLGGDADSNAVSITLNYNWDGIRISR